MFFQNWPRIARLAAPSVLSFILSIATGTLSLLILGHHGALVIAIIGVSNIIIYNCWALFSGISYAVNYLVAQNFGEQKMDQGVQRTHIATGISLVLFLIMMIVAFWGTTSILQFVGGDASKDIVAGADYLTLRIIALAIGLMTFMYHGFFRGVGDTRTPMFLMMLGSFLTIGFTLLLTLPDHLSTAQVLINGGISFLIGETVCLLFTLWFFYVKLNRTYRTRTQFRWNWEQIKLITKESGKLGIQEFSISFSMLLFTVFVARLGEVALAANEIALNVMAVGFMVSFAFSSTATILVGQEVGKGNPLLAKRLGTDAMVMATAFILVFGVLEFIFAGSIAKFYTDVPQVYELVAVLIMVSAFLQVFDTVLNVLSGGLRGIGDTTFLLATSFGLSWLGFVPLSYVAIYVWDLGSIGAWSALYLFILIYCLFIVMRYYSKDWTRISVKS